MLWGHMYSLVGAEGEILPLVLERGVEKKEGVDAMGGPTFLKAPKIDSRKLGSENIYWG